MQSEPRESKPRTWRDIVLQVLVGIALGVFLVGIPLSYVWYFTPQAVQSIHIGLSVGFTLLCGLTAGLWGDRVIDVLTKLVESMPST